MACRRKTMEPQSQVGSSERIGNSDFNANVFHDGAGVQAAQLGGKDEGQWRRIHTLFEKGRGDRPTPHQNAISSSLTQALRLYSRFRWRLSMWSCRLPRQELLAHRVPAHDSYCAGACGDQVVVSSEKSTRREWFVEVGGCGKATTGSPAR